MSGCGWPERRACWRASTSRRARVSSTCPTTWPLPCVTAIGSNHSHLVVRNGSRRRGQSGLRCARPPSRPSGGAQEKVSIARRKTITSNNRIAAVRATDRRMNSACNWSAADILGTRRMHAPINCLTLRVPVDCLRATAAGDCRALLSVIPLQIRASGHPNTP